MRTYLCPKCDGYGATSPGCDHAYGDPACSCEVMCSECDESGVVTMGRDRADRLGLQPWTGNVGRSAKRLRIKRVEALDLMRISRGVSPWTYRTARDRAMKPVKLPGRVESYLDQLRRTDPIAAEVLAPVLNFLMPRAA